MALTLGYREDTIVNKEEDLTNEQENFWSKNNKPYRLSLTGERLVELNFINNIKLLLYIICLI